VAVVPTPLPVKPDGAVQVMVIGRVSPPGPFRVRLTEPSFSVCTVKVPAVPLVHLYCTDEVPVPSVTAVGSSVIVMAGYDVIRQVAVMLALMRTDCVSAMATWPQARTAAATARRRVLRRFIERLLSTFFPEGRSDP